MKLTLEEIAGICSKLEKLESATTYIELFSDMSGRIITMGAGGNRSRVLCEWCNYKDMTERFVYLLKAESTVTDEEILRAHLAK